MIFTPCSDIILQSLPSIELSDDASESSTFAVGFASTPKRRRAVRRVKKSVAFDESKNTTYECQHSQAEDSCDTWYSAYEIQGFRSLNAFALKKLERASTELVGDGLLSVKSVIDHTYAACQGMLFDDIEVLCPVETAQLHQALRDPVFPVGLASYASVPIRRDVRERRRKVVEAVLLIQRTVGTSAANTDDAAAGDAVVANFIRQSSENISRPSRIFAQLIAENQCDYYFC